jgi:hypothetical protein
MILGLIGYKQSGKSSVANHLINKSNFEEVSWAYPLKEYIGRNLFKLDDGQLYGDSSRKEEKIPQWKMSPREILQKVGTDLFRKQIHPDFWVITSMDRIITLMQKNIDVVVSDCRFPNEVKAIEELGGYTVRITRLGQNITDVHESERALEHYNADFNLYAQDNGVAQLRNQIDRVVKEIRNV